MDLSVYETLNGGDVVLKGNDLQLVESLFNQPYLAMFGGNREQSHVDADEFENTLERFDYWGNMLFFPESEEQQFNSELERELDMVVPNSVGLQELEQVLKEDLKYLRPVAEVSVSVTLDDVDRVQIDILLREPSGLQERNFVFLWDGTRLEEIGFVAPEPAPTVTLLGDEGQELLGDDGVTLLFGD